MSSNRTIRSHGVSILFPSSFTGEQTFTPGHAPRLAVLAMPDQPYPQWRGFVKHTITKNVIIWIMYSRHVLNLVHVHGLATYSCTKFSTSTAVVVDVHVPRYCSTRYIRVFENSFFFTQVAFTLTRAWQFCHPESSSTCQCKRNLCKKKKLFSKTLIQLY